MPRLLLLRHAKAAPGGGLADINRPLAERGRAASALMADVMAERGLLPEQVICSTARRTRETLAALLVRLAEGTTIGIHGDLYEPQSGDYRGALAAHGKGQSLLLIGHNPAIQQTALHFIGSGEPALRAAVAGKYPTAGLAVIDFPEGMAWDGLPSGGGSLVAFLTPATVGGEGDD